MADLNELLSSCMIPGTHNGLRLPAEVCRDRVTEQKKWAESATMFLQYQPKFRSFLQLKDAHSFACRRCYMDFTKKRNRNRHESL